MGIEGCSYSPFTGTSCVAVLPPGYAPYCRYEHYDLQQKKYVWDATDCTLAGAFAPVALYYRDRWVDELDATVCTPLWSVSRLAGPFNLFLSSPPPELAMGTFAFVEPTRAFWWSGPFSSGCPQ